MPEPFPVKIQRLEACLEITWNDGRIQKIGIRTLRDQCPCATCREKASIPKPALPILSQAETGPISISNFSAIGNYAYGIQFSDGHSSGVYTLEYLYSLNDQESVDR